MAAGPEDLFLFPSDPVIGRPSYQLTLAASKPFDHELDIGSFGIAFPVIIFLDTLLFNQPVLNFKRSFERSSSYNYAYENHKSPPATSQQSQLLGWVEFLLEHFFLATGFLKHHTMPQGNLTKRDTSQTNINLGLRKIDATAQQTSSERTQNDGKVEGSNRRPGNECLLRFICELQNYDINDASLLAGAANTLFSFDNNDVKEDVLLQQYLEAQDRGRRLLYRADHKLKCRQHYNCPHSLFDHLQL